MQKEKIIRIIIKSLEDNLKTYVYFLVKILNKLNISYRIIKLPSKTKKLTLLKSPHVNKKSREQFKCVRFKNIIEIKIKNQKIINLLILNKPKFIKISLRKIN